MQFNEKLVYLRKKNGMTQENLAFKLGISRQSVSKWENGETEPELSKLKEIANIFSVSFNYLLDDSFQENDLNEQSNIEVVKTKGKDVNTIVPNILILSFSTLTFVLVLLCMYFSERVERRRRMIIGFLLDNWEIDGILLKIIMISSIIFIFIGSFNLIRNRRDNNEKFNSNDSK